MNVPCFSTLNKPFKIAMLLAGLIMAPISAKAVTVLWDGGATDNLWTSGDNWGANAVPTTVDDVQFGNNAKNTVDLGGNVIVNTMHFISGASSYTIGNVGTANTITVGYGFTGSPDGTNDIRNLSSAQQTINANIIQNGATAINASHGNITVNGSVNFNNAAGSRFLAAGSNTLVLNGQITGNLGTTGTGTIAFNGGGTIEVRGATNNYTATTHIWGGTVRLFTANGFGSSTNAINLGLNYNGGRLSPRLMLSDAITLSRNITLASANTLAETGNAAAAPNNYTPYLYHSYTIGGDTAQVVTYSGTITNSNDSQSNIAAALNVTAVSGGRVNINNIVRGTSAQRDVDDLNKIGLGTVAITGTLNNYQGVTNVDAGTLLVNGSLLAVTSGKGVSVKAAATFGGRGTVQRAVTLASNATLAAGDPTVTNGLGLFTIGTGSGAGLTLAAGGGSILGFQISAVSDINGGGPLTNMNSNGTMKWADIIANTGGAYGKSAALNNDTLSIQGNLVANTSGTTVVQLSATSTVNLLAGSVWDLMDWTGSSSATNASYSFQIDTALQSALTAQGLFLDTSRFWDTGMVAITPEPGRSLLMLIGCCLLMMRRRR